MLLRTHIIFNAGLMSIIATALTHRPLTSIAFSLLTSVLGNILIDGLGHEEVILGNRVLIRRTPRTHTLPKSIAWGFLPAPLLIALLNLTHSLTLLHALTTLLPIALINGPAHMLLDSLTEHGIYRRVGGKWVRYSIAHLRSNNPLINTGLTMLGILMLTASLSL
ncbi:DUF1286 domain-containing protein [Vulcanisaeta sp. JCM 14467]|uniref:DUF1286 domain-containing protein n=1 Tax=Vulcanisaeta sp. JCM 14467 TaxID=1295370 RepID=UPI0006CF76F2|nr:DUF1286 domain-containing protein [Vulcanisaeta sp. JCM 14467]